MWCAQKMATQREWSIAISSPMFLPVDRAGGMTRGEVEPDTEENMEDTENMEMENTEDMGEQAGEESDRVEDLEVDNPEDNVEKCVPGTINGQCEHTELEEVDTETGRVSEGEEGHVTARGTSLPPRPNVPRRNAQRNRRPPKKLSCELRAMESEEDRQKIERGWKLWQRAKARRAAGHTLNTAKAPTLMGGYMHTFSS